MAGTEDDGDFTAKYAASRPLGAGVVFTNQTVPEARPKTSSPPPTLPMSVECYQDVRYPLNEIGRLVGDMSMRHLVITLLRGISQSSIEEIRELYRKGIE